MDSEREFIIQTHKELSSPSAQDKNLYRSIAMDTNQKFGTTYWDSERVRDIIRKDKDRAEREAIRAMQVPEFGSAVHTSKRKILVLFDLHFPYQREDVFEIISKNLKGLDAIVFGGDTFNNDALSSFPSTDVPDFDKELIDFYRFISEIRELVPSRITLYFIRGNHESRLYKYIANQASHSQLATFVDPEVINMLVTGFTIFHEGYSEKFAPIPNIKYIPHWFMNINNQIIICHPISFSRIQLKTVAEAIDYFMDRGEQFSAVAVGHMHMNGYTVKHGKHGYNVGCLCRPQKYADSGKLVYRPQNYGYMLVVLDSDGIFDPNESRLVTLDEKYPYTRETIEYNVDI